MSDRSIADLRRDYQQSVLDETHVATDPITQFEAWFSDAESAACPEPNAMTLATVDPAGAPSARIVLLKGVDERGFQFFTNRESRKGRELAVTPRGCLVFWWAEVERQVRIEGWVEPLNRLEDDAYFRSRPRGSQVGAWVSQQSRPITSRRTLEQLASDREREFAEQPEVPRPPHWGGFLVRPTAVEFWQGRSSRLHDRLVFELTEESGASGDPTRLDDLRAATWTLRRLQP